MLTACGLMLRHYSHHRIDVVRSVTNPPGGHRKPRGFWLSVDGSGEGWADWCKENDFDSGWRYVYGVNLSRGANILMIEDVSGLDSFTEEYGVSMDRHHSTLIEWARVADDYQGVIISPYQWGRRLDGPASGWYYGWDCASGCIWDADAVGWLMAIDPEGC